MIVVINIVLLQAYIHTMDRYLYLCAFNAIMKYAKNYYFTYFEATFSINV